MSKRLTLAVVVALAGALVLAAPATAYTPGPAAGHVMGGLTKQDWPIILVVSKNARAAPLVEVGLDMTCSAGDRFSTQDAFAGVLIHRGGGINVSQAIAPSGSLLGGHHSLRGRLNRKAARFAGTWELHVDFATPNGQVDSCDSGSVPVRAIL